MSELEKRFLSFVEQNKIDCFLKYEKQYMHLHDEIVQICCKNESIDIFFMQFLKDTYNHRFEKIGRNDLLTNPLVVAAKSNNEKVVEFLLQNGCDPDNFTSLTAERVFLEVPVFIAAGHLNAPGPP